MAHDERRALERLRNALKRTAGEALAAGVTPTTVADELADLATHLAPDHDGTTV